MVRFFGAAAALVLLTACIDKKAFETAPVTLETPQGDVTCQLYTDERVMWDESIAHPQSMTKEAADKLCWNEGVRIQQALSKR